MYRVMLGIVSLGIILCGCAERPVPETKIVRVQSPPKYIEHIVYVDRPNTDTDRGNNKSNSDISSILVAHSIAQYANERRWNAGNAGSCPCPDSGGTNCRTNNVYDNWKKDNRGTSIPRVLCYVSDVTDKMIQDYRRAPKRCTPTTSEPDPVKACVTSH